MTAGPEQLRDAAYNAVAVASLAYQQAVAALTHVLACARGHGLSVADLRDASGLDEAFINRLLQETPL